MYRSGFLACLAVAVIAWVASLWPLGTVIRQINLMSGTIDPQQLQAVLTTYTQSLQRESAGPMIPYFVMRDAASGTLTEEKLARYEKASPSGNRFYDYMRVLLLFRQAKGNPSDISGVEEQIYRRLPGRYHLEPAKVGLGMLRTGLMRSGLLDDELSYRMAAPHLRNTFLENYREVLGELSDDLMALGDRWRERRQLNRAMRAHAAIGRLMVDVVEGSPVPEVALFAADRLPEAMGALAVDATAAGDDDYAARCRQTAETVEQFRTAYEQSPHIDTTNLIPMTRDSVEAYDAHQRVLRSMCAAAETVLVALVMWAIVIALLPRVLLQRAAPDEPSHMERRRGAYIAAGVFTSFVAIDVACWALLPIDFAWLFSERTLPLASLVGGGAWWLPGVLMTVVMIAVIFLLTARLCLNPAGRPRPVAAWIAAGILLLSAAVGMTVWPVNDAAWSPPALIQRFRTTWALLCLESVVIALAWIAYRIASRGRGRPPATDRWMLLLAGACTLASVSVLMLVTLIVNTRLDARHASAFAAAELRPIADRLDEPDWYAHYFRPAADVLKELPENR